MLLVFVNIFRGEMLRQVLSTKGQCEKKKKKTLSGINLGKYHAITIFINRW